MKHYLNLGGLARKTPQTEPIAGKNMVANNAGGYGFAVDDVTRLQRFLILGTTGGTYYVGERELTKQNLDVVERLLVAGKGHEVIAAIVEISRTGRAVSNDPALFALACCAADDAVEIRRAAFQALPQVARIGTHLLHFVAYVKQFRGWGPAYRRAIAAWFNEHDVSKLAYQMVKYQQRDGYSQRDLLRLAHPKTQEETRNTLYHWIVKGWESVGDQPHPDDALKIVWAYERAKRAQDDNEVAGLIRQYHLPREAVPTNSLHAVDVWEALLEDMPLEAMTRNLATMTKEGVIKPLGNVTRQIAERLRNGAAIRKARLHPIKLLAALTTYASGKGVRGNNTWQPVPEIIDALNDAFYLSFDAVEPTNKRILLAIDTSGSMHVGKVNGIPHMDLHTACGAMAMTIAKVEPHHRIIGVDMSTQELSISPKQRLDDVVNVLKNTGGGGTNLALPFEFALKNKETYDAIVTLTDSETWAGKQHIVQTLDEYRKRVQQDVRVVNIQMTATHVTNNDANDKLALEIVGFDTVVPSLLNDFIKGEI